MPQSKSKGGRPDKYESHVKPYLKEIPKWRKAGAKVEDIFTRLGIAKSTGYKLQREHSEFADALKEGNEALVIELESALYKRALGYDYKEVMNEESEDGYKKRVTVKHVTPDVGALAFALKTLKPDKYDNVNQRLAKAKEDELKLKYKEVETMEKGITINITQEMGDYSGS
jgi:ACT domain-containing protein